MLKILQTIRLLSRNTKIQNLLYQDNILNYFESIIEKLMKNKSINQNSEMLENLLIEIISIIKRYFLPFGEKEKEEIQSNQIEFVEKIINESKIFDQMIFLLNKENLNILKLLHFILISVIKK